MVTLFTGGFILIILIVIILIFTINSRANSELDFMYGDEKADDIDPKSNINAKLADLGFKENITPQGISKNRVFSIEIANNGNKDIRWLRFEVFFTFKHVKQNTVYSSIIVDGTTRGSSRTCVSSDYNRYRIGRTWDQPLLKGQSRKENNLELTLPNLDPDTCNGLNLYQIYGEFANGDKFQQFHYRAIEFDSNGYCREHFEL